MITLEKPIISNKFGFGMGIPYAVIFFENRKMLFNDRKTDIGLINRTRSMK